MLLSGWMHLISDPDPDVQQVESGRKGSTRGFNWAQHKFRDGNIPEIYSRNTWIRSPPWMVFNMGSAWSLAPSLPSARSIRA